MAQEEEECEPCKVGVLLGITKYVCEQNVSGEQKQECDDLYEKCVLGEISVRELVAKIKERVTDPQDLKTLESVEEVAMKYDLTPEKIRQVAEETVAQATQASS